MNESSGQLHHPANSFSCLRTRGLILVQPKFRPVKTVQQGKSYQFNEIVKMGRSCVKSNLGYMHEIYRLILSRR